jgi:DNA-binding response OmpR family regulator
MEALVPNKPLIFVVDDEQPLLQQIALTLEEAGYEVKTAREGLEALDKIEELVEREERKPDVVLLDVLMPPGLDGQRTATLLRKKYPPGELAIIMMTEPEMGREADMLEYVDDFISKTTWSIKVLLTRIERCIPKQKMARKLVCDELEIDLEFRQARLRGQVLKISQLNTKLLIYLMQHPHNDIHYNKILENVWPGMLEASENQVRIATHRIRDALQDYGKCLVAVLDEGNYRWVKDVTSVE